MRRHLGFSLASAAVVYAGPILAGWSGLGRDVIPPFTLIFLAYVTLSRYDLSHPEEGWRATVVWVRLALVAVVQLVLVGLCVALGAGLAWLTRPLGLEPVWPLALSALSLPLAWRIGRTDTREMDALLDDMTRQLETMDADFASDAAATDPDPDPEGEALADLRAAPPSPETLHRILDIALDPAFALPRCGSGDVADALNHVLNLGDGAMLRRLSAGGIALLEADPAMDCEMPMHSHLVQRADDMGTRGEEAAADALRRLAAALDDTGEV